MTQPSINTMFDASLVDISPNMSSDPEFNPPGVGVSSTTQKILPSVSGPFQQKLSQETSQTPDPVSLNRSRPVQHIGTQDAYDQWASVYDSDGNMLQSIDDDELNTLLPPVLNRVTQYSRTNIYILDLGCGTGRNTARLVSHTWPSDVRVCVTGLDFSAGMLQLAHTKLAGLINPHAQVSLRLEQCDPFPATANFIPSTIDLTPQDLVISTLVLEHIPLATYFSTLSTLLAPGGIALVTNMHSEMGSRSQAGFVNAQGVKVRGESFVYSLAGTVAEAKKRGFEIVDARERSIEQTDIDTGVVGSRGGKWIGCRVWYGLVLRKGL